MFVNEFVAYAELGKTINFRNEIISNNTIDLYRNGSLSLPLHGMIWNVIFKKNSFFISRFLFIQGNLNQERSIVIATYALCGFANFASIGLQIGVLSVMCPTKSKLFSKVAGRAMLAGNITNLINGKLFYLKF